MQFLKQNIFGILAILIGCYLLYDTYDGVVELQRFNEVEQHVAIENTVEPGISGEAVVKPGWLEVSLIFLTFLLIPVVLTIIHKRKKGNPIIFYSALLIVLINFLFFPYLLTKMF